MIFKYIKNQHAMTSSVVQTVNLGQSNPLWPPACSFSLFVSILLSYPSLIISYHVFICLIPPSPPITRLPTPPPKPREAQRCCTTSGCLLASLGVSSGGDRAPFIFLSHSLSLTGSDVAILPQSCTHIINNECISMRECLFGDVYVGVGGGFMP